MGFGRTSVFKSSTTIGVFLVLVAANYGPRFAPDIPFLGLVSLITLPASILYNIGPGMLVSSFSESIPVSMSLVNQVGLVATFYLFAVIIGYIHREHSSGF